MSARHLCLAASVVLAAHAGPAAAEDVLERVAAAREALAGARAAPDDTPALAAAVSTYEEALADLRAEIIAGEVREREIALGLAGEREQIAALIAALQSRPPAEAQATGLHPGGPQAAARARRLAEKALAALEADVGELAQTLDEVAAGRRAREEAFHALGDHLEELAAARAELAEALTAAAARPGGTGPDPEAAAMIAASESLTALAAALSRTGGGDGDAPTARLRWPVRGPVLAGFEDRDGAGVRRPGLMVGASPRAAVTAPAAGAVRYAGPFLDFGYVVVLALDAGATVVLAGLADLTVETGATVAGGEVLGLMGGRPLAAEEYVMLSERDTGAGAREALYIEIRHGDGPVDPRPWFDAENG